MLRKLRARTKCTVTVEKVHGGGDAEFQHQPGFVRRHGFVAHAEAFSDLFIAPALTEESENLQLAIAEGRDAIVIGGLWNVVGLGKGGPHEFVGDRGTRDELALVDQPDAIYDTRQGFIFHQVAMGAGAEQASGIDVFVASGEYEGGWQDLEVVELFDQGPAVAIGKVQVEHEHIGVKGRGLDQSLTPGSGFADYAQIRFCGDGIAEAVA